METRLTKLRQHAEALAANGEPGLVCGVRLNGSLLWEMAAGIGDRIENTPITTDRKFCVFSITKSFTAACYLKMRVRFNLSLDALVQRWFPAVAPGLPIALRHLFRHTAGVRDYGSSQKYYDAVRTRPSQPWTEAEYLADTLERGVLFDPDARWAYSNVGYLLLKRILEMESGYSFKECLARYVFEPLDLTNSFVAEALEDWAECLPGYARDFTDGDLADVRNVYHPGWCAPGVAVSTIQDVTAFFTNLFQGNYLSETDRSILTDLVKVPGNHPPAVRPSYGLGVMADPEGVFGPSFGHGGEGPGYSVSATVLPRFHKGCLSVAVFRNGSHGLSGGKTLHRLLPDIVEAIG